MSISIVFPIGVGDNGTTVSNSSTSNVITTGLGLTSYADQSPQAAIKQNFKMLLLTRKGEYVMDANYGVGLPDYLFLQEQEINTSALQGEIISQARTYLPYMVIDEIDVSIDELAPALKIRVQFYYNGLAIPEVFELEVN